MADSRIHYMDNLRALAMLAGVVFHAALAHSLLVHGLWPPADAGHSWWVDVAAWFPHLFRMPLFFTVAGFFAALLVERRGVGGMLANRARRVLLPLVIFWPLVTGAIIWATLHAAVNVQNPSPLLAIIRQAVEHPGAPSPPPSLTHLWFLYYLMWFYLLVWVVTALQWRAEVWRSRLLRPWVVAGVAPLLLAPSLLSVTAPAPAPESFLPQWWALVYFGLFFAFGYQLHGHREMLDRLRPRAGWMLGGSVAAYALFMALLARQLSGPPMPVLHAAQVVLEAYSSVWMTLWCLLAAQSWLNVQHRVLRYLSDASYWVYIIHLPLVFAIQYRMLDLAVAWPLKFALSLGATLAVAFGSYHLLVRGTFAGRLLNGARQATEDQRVMARIA
jgi:glucans biosynthesis protein C